MKPYRNFKPELIKHLKEAGAASDYLTLAFEEGDKELFLLALKDVVEARGGMTKLAKTTKLNREHLYRILSRRGNPEIYTLETILEALGLHFAVLPTPSSKSKLRKAA